ncbi:hypothetical protein FBEOM_13794 [Fusarium beomiforme]|uniref:Uncharacterized protein n=1 Tax=Fusarium beomiforme TaxID=44412 RepID=A0A9P5A6A7_9HYPO|nr:hypothetical protein FBEOM_13794 [Fusarium beomiforme]
MWPPKLRDHQPDGHDVEQNETNTWQQHTGWPRLFHNRPLGIITATVRKSKPAWNEDYLLGQWHDTALRSPAVVETQLRVILRSVDLMVDRATFTVQHFETHQQQDIYNLRLGRDETAMMRYILYLVALLQREAESSNLNLDQGSEEEEDEPSDDDGDEDEDEDSVEANDEYIREYDRVETENYFNKNDKYHDIHDEDELSVNSTFSLPSGLWLHLSEAIF